MITIIHGLGDHGGHYTKLAEHLTSDGHFVCAVDLMGHGKSPGRRGCVDSYHGILKDVACTLALLGDRFPSAKHCLLGHSMGGNIALNYALRQSEFSTETGRQLDALVMCGPVLLPSDPLPRPKILAAWLTGHLFRWVTFNRPVHAAQLSTDHKQAIAILNDPLAHSRLSLYLATQIVSQGRWAIDNARQLSIPTLIMYGDDDELIDTTACEHLAIRIGKHATSIAWPGTKHDLFHDVTTPQVIDRLNQWLPNKLQ